MLLTICRLISKVIQDILLIAYLAKVQIKKCVLDAKAGEKLITI